MTDKIENSFGLSKKMVDTSGAEGGKKKSLSRGCSARAS